MAKRFKLITRIIFSIQYAPRYSRLYGDMESYEPQLQSRINEQGAQDKQWAIHARELLRKARNFLDEYKIDEAWKAFHTAKRMEIFGMNAQEMANLADELRKEVAKLNEWRREAIFELIGKTRKETPEPLPAATLVRAEELKDEYYNNQYYKNRLTRSLFRLLFVLLFMVIAGIIIFFFLNGKILESGDPSEGFGLGCYLAGVLLFGLLGAITSSILFTRNLSESTRITELGSNKTVTLSKIFVGAGFTVFIFLLLKSSIAESIQLFNFSIDSPVDYFAIAFVSGFSERLAQKAIEAIVGKDTPPKKEQQQATS